MSLPLYPKERDPVPIVEETGWTSGPVCMGVENLDPTSLNPDPLIVFRTKLT